MEKDEYIDILVSKKVTHKLNKIFIKQKILEKKVSGKKLISLLKTKLFKKSSNSNISLYKKYCNWWNRKFNKKIYTDGLWYGGVKYDEKE